MRPTIMGSISSPDSAAEVPEDICRNVGTKAMAANMPRPRVKPMAVAFTKIRFLNRLRGMMGSSARRSNHNESRGGDVHAGAEGPGALDGAEDDKAPEIDGQGAAHRREREQGG